MCVAKMSHFNSLIEDIVLQKEVFITANSKIAELGFHDINVLIKNRLEAQIDPGLMIKALMTKALSLGIQLYNNCYVEEINLEGSSVMLKANA